MYLYLRLVDDQLRLFTDKNEMIKNIERLSYECKNNILLICSFSFYLHDVPQFYLDKKELTLYYRREEINQIFDISYINEGVNFPYVSVKLYPVDFLDNDGISFFEYSKDKHPFVSIRKPFPKMTAQNDLP